MNEAASAPESGRDLRYFTLRKKHIRQYDSEFLAFSGADPGMSVLEVGCGTGIFSRYLRYKGFADVVCLDLDENLAPVLADLDPYQVVFDDAETYVKSVLGKRTFDMIVLHDVLEHVPLDKACSMFRAFDEVLAPGGRIVVRVPNLSSPWGGRIFYGNFDHVTPYSPDRIKEFAGMVAFRVVKIDGQRTGKRRKQIASNILHAVLSGILPEHPEIWEANIVALLEKQNP